MYNLLKKYIQGKPNKSSNMPLQNKPNLKVKCIIYSLTISKCIHSLSLIFKYLFSEIFQFTTIRIDIWIYKTMFQNVGYVRITKCNKTDKTWDVLFEIFSSLLSHVIWWLTYHLNKTPWRQHFVQMQRYFTSTYVDYE